MEKLYYVVVNEEKQYSIWESALPVPAGWSVIGEPALEGQCLDTIEQLWTDMRPASLQLWAQALDVGAPTRPSLVSAEHVEQAAVRIKGHVNRTKLVEINSAKGLYVKSECEQPTNSFKVRGGINAVTLLADEDRLPELVVHSSGNHARSIAYAAQRHGIKVTAVLPDTAPRLKVDAIRHLGSEVVIVPSAERENEARRICARTGGRLVLADDFDVIAGAGTIGLEIMEDLPDTVAILVPVCSGSQLAGIATALRSRHPSVRVIGVEPDLAADGAESFRKGVLTAWPAELTHRTIADGLRAPSMGQLAWEHIRRYAEDIVTVDEGAIREASALLQRETAIFAEPSGVVGLAAFLRHQSSMPAGPVVAVVTGGNVADAREDA